MRRVIKVGGSLLEFGGLRRTFPRWLAVQRQAANVVIVGGGALVEAIRDLDRRLALGEEAAHWLSIQAMGITARLAAALWPEFMLVGQWETLHDQMGASTTPLIFDAEEFLRRHELVLPGAALPHSWSVTSDSIAARVAESLAADELVLLKPALPHRSSISLTEAASREYVDSFFPGAAQSLPRIRAVNLRSADWEEIDLVPSPPVRS
jgi:aspartokinase-like uncharacterized kinase